MGPDNPFVKFFLIAILVAVAAHFGLKWKNEQERQVQATVTAVRTIAAELTKESGSNIEAISTAVSPLHEVSFSNLSKGLLLVGSTQEEYVAAELILLRIYEIDRTAVISTHIKLEGKGSNWPWVFDGESAKLEPFRLEPGAEVGSMEKLMTMYREQGMLRKPWKQ